MKTIYEIIQELNESNSSNYKLEVLKKYQDNELLKRVLKFTYDKVAYNFYVTMKNINRNGEWNHGAKTLEEALDILENELVTRNYTGNAAIGLIEAIFNDLSEEDGFVFEKIIDRDLRINLGRKQINKVFKKLITEFPYMRCSLMDKLNRIEYPAIVQEKMDGTYRSIVVDEDIEVYARSGEKSNLPYFESCLEGLPKGVYIGELLIQGENDRFKANGLINSDTEPEGVYAVVWDYLTIDEWKAGKSDTAYKDRLVALIKYIENHKKCMKFEKSEIIHNFDEAKEFYKKVIKNGGEGAVLKNMDNKFKNGTAQDNIKMKEEAVAEFKITGFQEGKGRFKGTLGALEVISGDEKIVTKVSGFTDKVRDDIWNARDALLNTIISVKYNGVSKARGSDVYSLMFPVFEDFRPDKDEADDLEYIKNALK
jgi:ATP-dependent DNA ligase